MSEITHGILETASVVGAGIYCADEVVERLGRLAEKVLKLGRRLKGDSDRTE